MAGNAQYRYRAFLSYRTADRGRAERLRRQLEAYRVPRGLVGQMGDHGTIPSRLGVIFRDRDEARSSADIETAISKALSESQTLIVLCSPATSEPGGWVGREIELFRQLRPDGEILTVIGAGDPPNIFPAELRFTTRNGGLSLPLAADLRPVATGGDGEARAKVKLIAGLLGVGFDDLWRRNRRRAIQRGVSATVAIIITVTVVTYVLLLLRDSALRQQSIALTEQSNSAIQAQDYGTAELIALAALPNPGFGGARPLHPGAAPALYTAWLHNRERQIGMHPTAVEAIAVSPDGDTIATGADDGSVRLWSASQASLKLVLHCPAPYVKDLVFSSDGRRLFATTTSGKDRLFATADGSYLDYDAPPDSVAALFKPDGAHLLIASPSDGATVFNLTGRTTTSIPLRLPRTGTTFLEPSPNGSWAITHSMQLLQSSVRYVTHLWSLTATTAAPMELAVPESDPKLIRWNARSDMVLMALQNRDVLIIDLRSEAPSVRPLEHAATDVSDAAFAPNGRSILLGAESVAELWDLATLQVRKLDNRGGDITAVGFSPDGRRAVATSTSERAARVWDLADLEASPIYLSLAVGNVKAVAFAPNGRTLWTGSYDGSVRTWDLGGEPVRALAMHADCGEIRHMSPSADGQSMATLSDQAVCIWTSLNGQPAFRVLGRSPHGESIALSPDGRYLATAGLDRTVRVWDLKEDPERPRDLEGHSGSIWSVRFSLDGHHLVTASDDGTARVWDLQRPADQPLIFGRPGKSTFSDAAFSPDGHRIVVAANDGVAHVWALDLPRQELELRGHGKGLNTAEFNASASKVVTASDDGTARIWDLNGDVDRPVVLQVDPGRVNHARFSPDGTRVVTISDALVNFVWMVSGRKVAPLDGHSHASWSVTWSPDGRWVATTSSDGTAMVWPIGAALPTPYVLQGHRGIVTSSSFDPGMRWIVTTSLDHTIRRWPFFADLSRLAETARSGLGRCLSEAQLQVLGLRVKLEPGSNHYAARPLSAQGRCD